MFRPVPREEVYRKLLHGLVVILPLGVFYGPVLLNVERWGVALLALAMFLLSLGIEIARFRFPRFGKWYFSSFGSMLREKEKHQLTGATYVAAATFFCASLSIISEGMAASACISLILFILGDAAAALVGKSCGRVRMGEKTLEGAIGCFLFCFALAYFLPSNLPDFSEKWGGEIVFWQAFFLGFVVAVLELFPLPFGKVKLNDNLYVPVLVTLIAYSLS